MFHGGFSNRNPSYNEEDYTRRAASTNNLHESLHECRRCSKTIWASRHETTLRFEMSASGQPRKLRNSVPNRSHRRVSEIKHPSRRTLALDVRANFRGVRSSKKIRLYSSVLLSVTEVVYSSSSNATNLLQRLGHIDHVRLHFLVVGNHTRLGTLDRQREAIHDYNTHGDKKGFVQRPQP